MDKIEWMEKYCEDPSELEWEENRDYTEDENEDYDEDQ